MKIQRIETGQTSEVKVEIMLHLFKFNIVFCKNPVLIKDQNYFLRKIPMRSSY